MNQIFDPHPFKPETWFCCVACREQDLKDGTSSWQRQLDRPKLPKNQEKKAC